MIFDNNKIYVNLHLHNNKYLHKTNVLPQVFLENIISRYTFCNIIIYKILYLISVQMEK